MKSFRLHPLRLARRLKQFNLSLLATLAALALTACDVGQRVPATASSSLSQGVQQILHAPGNSHVADGTHIAQAAPR